MTFYGVIRITSVLALTGCLSGPVFASTFTPSTVPIQAGASIQHADLNNDGREDFAYINTSTGAIDVVLSTGDATYASQVAYIIPGGADANEFAIGDFNSDGKADLIAFGSDKAAHLFLNNGSGKFSQKATFALSNGGFHPTVGDFNHDGLMDVAFQSGTSNGKPILRVWFGNGKSGFTVGPTSSFPPSGGGDYVLPGDFDGDGKADLAFGAFEDPDITILYGDGAGRFPGSSMIQTDDINVIFSAADVNSDGKMDIIGTQPSAGVRHVSVFYGKANRTWSLSTVATLYPAFDATAADVNGDGINDLIVIETGCRSANASCLAALTRNSNGTYNPQQIIYGATGTFGSLDVVRATRDTKPDLILNNLLLRNTTSGNFPGCAPPNAFEGINVCLPVPGTTVTTTVPFSVGAAGQVAMRKVEVWADGKKITEQLNGFSHYTFLNRGLSLAGGLHNITIFAAGWDNSLQEKKFTLRVR